MSFVSGSARDRAQRVAAVVRARLALTIAWLQENLPLVGQASARRRRRIVLEPYRRVFSLKRSILSIVVVPALVFGCLVYGFFFGLSAPYLVVPFAIPIALLAAMIIWALPHQRKAPTLPLEALMCAYIITLILWPKYLAVSLPGLPWITMARLLGLPMLLYLLINLSVSRAFQRRALESVSSIKLLWIFLVSFIALQIVTIPLSNSPFSATQIVFNMQIDWTVMFVISCLVFRDTRYVERYWALLCVLAVPILIITAVEYDKQYILWASHIPKFLQVPDPSVQLILKPSFRPYINLYRAKATFATPLVLAEYLSLLTPFLLHFGLSRINVILRVACFAMIPACFLAIRATDARLGIVGMLVSLLLYGMIWSILRWRNSPRDLFAAASVYAYPAILLAGVGAVFASQRLNNMVLGGGAQAGSTAARENQLDMAMAQLRKAPWGHGTGQSGLAMGYSEGDFVTIDNYFITISLDYGILGILFWYGMFLIAIFMATKYALSPKYTGRKEAQLLAPLAVALTAFLIIKWVHGQADTHQIEYMELGMISALIYNLRNSPSPRPDDQGDKAPPAYDDSRTDHFELHRA